MRPGLRRALVATVAAVALTPIITVVGAAPASAATDQFKGMNWAVLGDNFSTTTLVLRGLSSSDSYATVKAKAASLYNAMAPMGVNTVRLPVNASTVGTAWWNSYRGTIDAATDRGWKVILGLSRLPGRWPLARAGRVGARAADPGPTPSLVRPLRT